jgi:hypothetical protein
MCVIAAKFLPEHGWIGIKNRDRNYKPVVSFIQSFKNGIERLLLRDDLTGYTEGLNEFGVSVLSAATLVKDDENEVREIRNRLRGTKKQRIEAGNFISKDGQKLRTILLEKDIESALIKLKELKPLGNHLLFDKKKCYIIEIDVTPEERTDRAEKRLEDPTYENPNPPVDIKVKKVSKNSIVVRTNHGIFLDLAGYQDTPNKMIGDMDDDEYVEWMKINRYSSEVRYDTSMKNLEQANTIEQVLNAVSDRTNKDPQLNPLRTGRRTDKKPLRTTGQIIIIPSKLKLIYRNIWSTVSETFNKVNKNTSKTYLDFISYEPDIYEENIKPYNDIKISFKDFISIQKTLSTEDTTDGNENH